MPLTFAAIDETNMIKRISGAAETRRHLENLGFVAGSLVRVVNRTHGNIIVSIKDSRIAISEELARKIMI